MTAVEILSSLEQSPFFESMSKEHLARIADVAEVVKVPAGRRLLSIGKPADIARIIVEGSVELGILTNDESAVRISTLVEGRFFGWSAIVPPHVWNYDAQAVNDCVFIQFPGETLKQMSEADSEFGVDLMTCVTKAITSRLAATRMALMDTYS